MKGDRASREQIDIDLLKKVSGEIAELTGRTEPLGHIAAPTYSERRIAFQDGYVALTYREAHDHMKALLVAAVLEVRAAIQAEGNPTCQL